MAKAGHLAVGALGSRGNGRSGLCACSRLEVRCAIVYRTGREARQAWQAGSSAARQDAQEEGSTWTVKQEPRRAGECGGGHEDEGLDRGEEAHGTAARTSGSEHRSRRKLRATKSTDAGMLKCEHVELQGDGARAGGPFILDLGRGSGGSGRGGGGAETACAVRRKRVGAEGGSWAAGLGGWCGGSRACSGCCGGWGSGWHLGLEPGWEGGPLEKGGYCVSLHAAESTSAAGLLHFSQRKGIFPSERGGGAPEVRL